MPLPSLPSDSQPQPDVASHLATMGIESADLRDAILAGNDEAFGCTENDVVTRPGFIRWSTPLRYLGDIYVPKGFSRERPRNFEMLVSPDESFALTVAPGDHATGTDRMPSTRIERGPLTGQAVTGNRDQLGFDATVHPAFADKVTPGMATWLLLQYYDERDQEIRLELSLPVEFTRTPKTERGYVTRFDPRLILPSIPLVETADVGGDEEEGDDQIDIQVARR